MLIVDSQVHVWGRDTPERPWPTSGAEGRTAHAQRDEPWSHQEVLSHMDRAGVARAVIVPPSWEGDRNDLALEAARQHPDRFAVMGRIDMNDPAGRERVAAWRSQPGMLGIRLLLSDSAAWFKDLADHWLWGAAERAGVPVTLVPKRYFSLVGDIAARHPRLKLCIDHMGCVTESKDADAFRYLPDLMELAAQPNIAVKASALPCYVSDDYPFPSLHHIVERVVQAFGPRRVFWGTDLTRLPCAYEQAIALFTKDMRLASDSDLEWIMGRGVCEWYGWPLP